MGSNFSCLVHGQKCPVLLCGQTAPVPHGPLYTYLTSPSNREFFLCADLACHTPTSYSTNVHRHPTTHQAPCSLRTVPEHGLELWLCLTELPHSARHYLPIQTYVLRTQCLVHKRYCHTCWIGLHFIFCIKNAHFGQSHSTTDYRGILLDLIKKSAKNAMVVMFKNVYQLKMPTEVFNGKMTRCLACALNSSWRKKKWMCLCEGREMKWDWQNIDHHWSWWFLLLLCTFLSQFYSNSTCE